MWIKLIMIKQVRHESQQQFDERLKKMLFPVHKRKLLPGFTQYYVRSFEASP